ncbi:hypothetical protein DYB37_005113 [Aphanomyces astaci]|uniref:RGS domain-containing protein n=2 Tax=Aphanomyces astaci TaxID=112090 RepID=A0A3R6X665_APHAT|nr:hypothetical protein DYB35_004224 [Aphanomyces astaci]RHZ17930.1 hypothetical protein DYB37_005113 [Aphanomyces astaci]
MLKSMSKLSDTIITSQQYTSSTMSPKWLVGLSFHLAPPAVSCRSCNRSTLRAMGSGASSAMHDEASFHVVHDAYLKGLESNLDDHDLFDLIKAKLIQHELPIASRNSSRSMGLLSTGAATPKELGATVPAEGRLHTPPPAAKPAQAVVPRVVLSETELSSAVHDERRRLHTMKVIIAHLHDPTKFRRASIVQESVIDSSFVEFSTDVLLDPVTLKMMTEFCSSIPHAAERLMFWADVQHLRTLPSAQYTDKMLRKIYEKFLSPHAATPICVPTDMIRGIQDEFDRPGGIQSAGVYLEAQALCLKDLEKDVFPRFEKHKLFDKMKALCEARSETGHATEYDCIYYLLYETYLKPNAKKFVALPPHIHEAFAAKVDADQLDSVAFTDVQYFVLDYVRTELWHDFS